MNGARAAATTDHCRGDGMQLFIVVMMIVAAIISGLSLFGDERDEAREAVEAFEQGHLERSVALFEEAVGAGDPNSRELAAIHNYRGVALVRLGRAGDASAAFDRARRLNPSRPEYHDNYMAASQAMERIEGHSGNAGHSTWIDETFVVVTPD